MVFDDGERTGPMLRSVGFGEPAAQEAVGLLVGRLLPGGSGFAEVHLDGEVFFDVGPAGHLASLVPCQGFDHVGGLAGQRGCDRLGGGGGAVAVGQRHHQGVAAGSFDQGGHCGAVGFGDDQVSLPVAGLGSGVGFRRRSARGRNSPRAERLACSVRRRAFGGGAVGEACSRMPASARCCPSCYSRPGRWSLRTPADPGPQGRR